MRKKNRNITPFIYLSPRLNHYSSVGKQLKDLQRSQTTVREKDVQLDSQQAHAQGYCNLHRLSEGRINHDVPIYDRNHIGIEDKWRKDVLQQICDSWDNVRETVLTIVTKTIALKAFC